MRLNSQKLHKATENKPRRQPSPDSLQREGRHNLTHLENHFVEQQLTNDFVEELINVHLFVFPH